MALLDVKALTTCFRTRYGTVRAVDGVSLQLDAGETLGIVGESGSGKSVTCYSILGLIPQPPARIESGAAVFDGIDLLRCRPAELRRIRGRRIAMIFQDPMASLNPYLSIGTQVMEPLRTHERISRRAARARAVQALMEVGIRDATDRIHSYAHEFSGGMRQRVMIAMALITRPEVLIADEPTTALDVTVQAQILDLIKTLQRDRGSAVVLVTHDLGIVAGFCDRVAVMYAGRIVETAATEALFYRPRHPYTVALQRALPTLHQRTDALYTIPGAPPEPGWDYPGCPFAPRCEHALPACETRLSLKEVEPGHHTACRRCQTGDLDLTAAAERLPPAANVAVPRPDPDA